MFNVDDKVRILRGFCVGDVGVVACVYPTTCEIDIERGGHWSIPKSDLELVEPGRTFVDHPDGTLEVNDDRDGLQGLGEPQPDDEALIRTFDSGATRDTVQGKLDYVKALSPIVLRRYAQYLDKNRLQSDGSYRDFDNWKNGIPQEVYHSGGGRHFMDTWLLTEGYATEDNHGPVEIEDAICAQLFNLMGRLHEMLKVKELKALPSRTAPSLGLHGYCPECEVKIREAMNGDIVTVCEKCAGVRSDDAYHTAATRGDDTCE